MDMRSSLARARGLGSAKKGVKHWVAHRFSAVLLIPLVLWFVVSVIAISGAPYGEFVAWVSQPWTATLLILLIAAVFYHAVSGVREVIEDYVRCKGQKMAALFLVQALGFLLALYSILSVLKIAFGG